MSVNFQINMSWFVGDVSHLSHNFWCAVHKRTHGLVPHNRKQLRLAYQVVGEFPALACPETAGLSMTSLVSVTMKSVSDCDI